MLRFYDRTVNLKNSEKKTFYRIRFVCCVNLSGKSKTYFNRTRFSHCKPFVFYTIRPPSVSSRLGGGGCIIKKVSPQRRRIRTRKENVRYSPPPEWIKRRKSFETDDPMNRRRRILILYINLKIYARFGLRAK